MSDERTEKTFSSEEMQPIFRVNEASDILRVQLPLPYAPGTVNAWLLADDEGWVVIDAGAKNDETLSFWRSTISNPIEGRPFRRFIATHHHTDHIALAGWFCREFEIPLSTSRTAFFSALALRSGLDGSRTETDLAFYRAAGAGDDFLAYIAERSTYRDQVCQLPITYTRLQDGDVIVIGGHEWKIITTEGHVPEQLTFYCSSRNILLSSDQVLPDIRPMIAAFPAEPCGDPLAAFAASLHRLRKLPSDCQVLPGHGAPFLGLHERIDSELSSRARRLVRLVKACDRARSAAEIVPLMVGRNSSVHAETAILLDETISHLQFLVARGFVKKHDANDGVVLYSAANDLPADEALALLNAT